MVERQDLLSDFLKTILSFLFVLFEIGLGFGMGEIAARFHNQGKKNLVPITFIVGGILICLTSFFIPKWIFS